MTSSNCRFLFKNGLIPNLAENPSVTTLLEAHQGAYTTTRTHNGGSLLLFWERHMSRLSNSLRILLNSNPELLFNSETCRVPFSLVSKKPAMWDSLVQSLVDDSMRKALPFVLKKRRSGEELAITCLVSGNVDSLVELEGDEEKFSTAFDVYVHYVNGNYHKASQRDDESTVSIELQTAPIRDGVLPGVLRQVILDICSRNQIPVREIAPSWSEREMWSEAFITNSLRLLQHVEVIQAPSSWESLEAQTWTDVTWEEKLFEHAPGRITALIQKEVMEMASIEGYPVSFFNEQ